MELKSYQSRTIQELKEFIGFTKTAKTTSEAYEEYMPNWIGQFYAFYQWENNIPSSQIIEKLPLDFMKASYYGLHDLDLELSVKKILKG